MWSLVRLLLSRQFFFRLEQAVANGQQRVRQVLTAYLVGQLGVLLVTLAFGFVFLALFFALSEQTTLLRPALLTGAVAFSPALVCLLIAERLFRR